MRSRSVFSAAAVLCGSLVLFPAVAGAVPSAATTWTGWDAPGPLGIGGPVHVAASGTTTAVLGYSERRVGVPIAVTAASGSRVGLVPTNATGNGQLGLALAGPDQLLLADECRIRRSTDRGLTWSGEPLAGCSGIAPQMTVLDDRVVFASVPTRTWRSTDGGATWAVVNAAESGPQVALDVNTGFRTVAAGPAAFALQRTTDGGASWQGLKLPGPIPPADPAAPVVPPTETTPAPPANPGETTPAPPTETTPTPPPVTNPLLDSLPLLAGLARRADGALLVGAGDVLLVSTDRGESFTRYAVPVPDDLPGAGTVAIDAIVCDPSGSCVVGVHAAKDATRRSALRFDGTSFGARVAALPPADIQSPAAGTIVGLTTVTRYEALVSSDLGATRYRTIASSGDRRGSIGVHGLLAIPSVGRLHVSSDHGASWKDVPLPETPAFRQVASVGGVLVALADDGTLRRFADGAWTTWADVSAIRPSAIAVSGDVPIVVGQRGVVRLADPAKTDPVSAGVLQGRGFSEVVAQGRTVIAWSGKFAVRSTDGGQHWGRGTVPRGADDVQLVTGKVGFALVGSTLYRTTDGGKRFQRRLTVPALGDGGPAVSDAAGEGIEFSSAQSGVLLTRSGPFATRDGGRTVAVLPTPGATTPAVAALFGGGAVLQDPDLGAVFRSSQLLSGASPSLKLRTSGRVTRRGGTRTLTVIGVLRKAVADEPVALVTTRGSGTGQTTRLKRVVTPNADGSFRVTVKLARGERGVQAWYRGAVRPDRTVRGTSSAVLKVR